MEFQESDKFQVLMNITAPSVGDAYTVHHEAVAEQGGLLLQVVCTHRLFNSCMACAGCVPDYYKIMFRIIQKLSSS